MWAGRERALWRQIDDLQDVFEGLKETLAGWRQEIEARRSAGERPAAQSFADILPVIVYRDPGRVSDSLAEIPEPARVRLLARQHRAVVETGADRVRDTGLLDPWELKQFAECGFFIQVVAFRPISRAPRGRRQLDQVEVQLREALALWAWALMPSIDDLAARMPGHVEGDVSAGLAFLAQAAPSLSALAAESLAKRPDATAPQGTSDRIGQLHGLLARLFDEGRRQRVVLHDQSGSARELFGAALQEALLGRVKGEILARRDPTLAAPWAAMRVGVLEALAKANLATRALGTAVPVAMRAFETGMDALEGQGGGPLATMSGSETGKRRRSSAGKVMRAVRLPEIVRSPSGGALISFDAGELALIGFFAGVDPFVFCAQNMLFAPEVFAARDLGQSLLGRSDAPPPGLSLIEDLLAWDPARRPPGDVWEEQLRRIRNAIDGAVSIVSLE